MTGHFFCTSRRVRYILESTPLVLVFFCFSIWSQSSFGGWPQPLKSPSGNFCQDELQEILRKRFGDHIRVYHSRNLPSVFHWNLWARTNLCKGWIMATFLNDSWECKRTHYFYRPRTLVAATGFDGNCQQIMPEDIHWEWSDQ